MSDPKGGAIFELNVRLNPGLGAAIERGRRTR
jgi:hypothetical protein